MHTAYLSTTPSRDGGLRLFCFHHAGGAASVFRAWRTALQPDVQVLPVQLPGREERVREPVPADMTTLVDELDEQLDAYLAEPYAFYGHSMGARVAHHVAQRRYARGASVPVALLVGASKAPHIPVPLVSLYQSADQQLIQAMVDIGGLSPLVLNYPAWVDAAVSLLRQDLRLCATEQPGPWPALPCPIDVFAAESDPMVRPEEADTWAAYSSVGCRVRRIPGDHFFLQRPQDRLLAELRAALGTPAASAQRC